MKISIKTFNIAIYIFVAFLIICCIDILHNKIITETLFFLLFALFWMFIKTEILTPIKKVSEYTLSRDVKIPESIFSEITTLENGVKRAFDEMASVHDNLQELIKAETARYEKTSSFLQKLFNNMQNGILIHDLDGNIIDVNDTTLEMYACEDKEKMLRLKIVDISTPNNPIDGLGKIWENVLLGQEQDFEWECKRQDDTVFYAKVYLTKVDMDDGALILANITDISEIKKQNALVKSIIDLQENMVALASNKQLLAYNESFARYFCFEDIAQANTHFHCIGGLFLDTPLSCEMISCKFGKKMRKEGNKLICESINGKKEVYLITTNRIKDENKYIVSLTEITDMELEKEALEIKSSIDHLTTLKNRASFDKILEFEINKSLQNKDELSLIMFDIDKFKDINDKYGHQVGDETLKYLAKIVVGNTRKNDTVARYGGEEFAIIAPGIDLNTAAAVADKIRKIIENAHSQGVPKFTCSFGVTALNGEENSNELIKRADDALYRAKEEGRNKVVSG